MISKSDGICLFNTLKRTLFENVEPNLYIFRIFFKVLSQLIKYY